MTSDPPETDGSFLWWCVGLLFVLLTWAAIFGAVLVLWLVYSAL